MDRPQLHPLSARNGSDMLRLAIDKQMERSCRAVPGGPFEPDPDGWARQMIQRATDLDLLVVLLHRFQRFAELVNRTWSSGRLVESLDAFAAAAPHLKEIRDTQEHWDEYRLGVGRRQRAGELEGGWGYGLGQAGGSVTYGEYHLHIAAAVEAAHDVHRAIRELVDGPAGEDVHGGPETILVRDP